MANKEVKKIVLAYSGGLDTSIILKWLKNEYGCKVVAFAADLGQGDELTPIRDKALATGADKVYIDDLREEFVRDFVFPMLRANAIYEGQYLLGTSIARPLIAKRQMEIAKMEKCDAVAHGATGKGNDQVRFELTYYHFNPGPVAHMEFEQPSGAARLCEEERHSSSRHEEASLVLGPEPSSHFLRGRDPRRSLRGGA
jgi:argininosuccinate synthase